MIQIESLDSREFHWGTQKLLEHNWTLFGFNSLNERESGRMPNEVSLVSLIWSHDVYLLKGFFSRDSRDNVSSFRAHIQRAYSEDIPDQVIA